MHRLGFNGAALFQVRKESSRLIAVADDAKLQWGRTFSSAERDSCVLRFCPPSSGFNGAALFQVRKADGTYDIRFRADDGFNGAALFQVRKVCAFGENLGGQRAGFNGAALFQVRKD